jgi:hypothetical protein
MTRHDRTIFGQLWALLGVQLSSGLSSELSSAMFGALLLEHSQ